MRLIVAANGARRRRRVGGGVFTAFGPANDLALEDVGLQHVLTVVKCVALGAHERPRREH